MKRSYKIGMVGLVAGLALTVAGAPHWWASAETDSTNGTATTGYYCDSTTGKTGCGMMSGTVNGVDMAEMHKQMMNGNFGPNGANMAEMHKQMMDGNFGPNGANMAEMHNRMMNGYTDKDGNVVRPMMQQNADGSYTCQGPQAVETTKK